MSELQLLPDVESIVIQYLKQQEDVLELLTDSARISSELKQKAEFPCLTAAQGPGIVRVERFLVGHRIQVDAWGGTREEARLLARTAHAALLELRGTQDLGIVTGVETILAPRKFPDPVNNRPRYLFEVRVWATPLLEQEAS